MAAATKASEARANKQKKKYERVHTDKQQRQFEETWEYFCRKYDWENDPYAPNGVRYNLIVPGQRWFGKRKVMGTIEFIPYDPNNPNSTVEGRYGMSFYALQEIRDHRERVWEVDKICLHEDYQRKGFFHIFPEILLEHAKEHKAKYYLGLMEEKFYRMLRIGYGLDVVRKGSPVQGPKTTLVPVVFNVESILHHEGKLNRLLGLPSTSNA